MKCQECGAADGAAQVYPNSCGVREALCPACQAVREKLIPLVEELAETNWCNGSTRTHADFQAFDDLPGGRHLSPTVKNHMFRVYRATMERILVDEGQDEYE